MAAWGHEFYLRVLKVSLTSEHSDCQVTLFQDGVPYFWREIQNTILGLKLSLFIGLLRFICQIVHFKTWNFVL